MSPDQAGPDRISPDRISHCLARRATNHAKTADMPAGLDAQLVETAIQGMRGAVAQRCSRS
jgi:hypothetical protein